MVVLPQFGDELSSLELNLWVGGQEVGRRLLSDHNIGLDVQIPVDPEDRRDSKQTHISHGRSGTLLGVRRLATHTAGR